MKNFLVCNKCQKNKIKFAGIKKTDQFIKIKLECVECGEADVCDVKEDDFVVWVKSPEITAAYGAFKKPAHRQENLW